MYKDLLDILEENHPGVDYETCTDLCDGGILDSFDIVLIIADIEGEFEIEIPGEAITPENFNSAQAIWELIERLVEE